jgi:hypothetical protein
MKNRFLHLMSMIVCINAFLGTNLLYPQTCGFATDLGRPITDYNNFGANSNNTTSTIEYDNLVLANHVSAVRNIPEISKLEGR